MRIIYDSFRAEYKSPFGVLRENESCRIRLDIPKTVPVTACELEFRDGCGENIIHVAMQKTGEYGAYGIFTAEFQLPVGLYFYNFRIFKPDSSFRLFKLGHDTNMEAGELWQLSCICAESYVPDWARNAVVYQVFPDRFCREGSCRTEEKLSPWRLHDNWEEMPDWRPNERGEVLNNDFFGGNLRGIKEKLPYLSSLGVTVIYLNPIFMAWSNHRYDTADYLRIDPLLGTEQDFKDLCAAAHGLGMRVILDGVFSHTGDRAKYFREALADPESPFRYWYDFIDYPNEYLCWWNFKTLPNLNKNNPDCRRYLLSDKESVIRHWLRAGADGWRLDVVDELPDSFVEELKQSARVEKADSVIIGEVWEDASNKIAYGIRRRYFFRGQLDGVMNYPLRKAILAFVRGEDSGAGFRNLLETQLENYPPEVLEACFSLLSSHDTPRMQTAISGGGSEDDREKNAVYQISPSSAHFVRERMKMAATLQFTLPGAPTVYYGDEAGMTGGKDPFCRQTFPWGREDTGLQNYYRELSKIHTLLPGLDRAPLEILRAENGILSYRRGDYQTICCSGHEWAVYPCKQVLLGTGYSVENNQITVYPGGYAIVEV